METQKGVGAALEAQAVRARMKHLAIFYIPFLVSIAVLCVLISGSSSYYASAYPYNTIVSLPHTGTTFLLSVFNGYSEKVPINANQTAILQGIGSIRNNAASSITSTIGE